MMDDARKSDGPIVPVKPSNKAERSAAERVEGKGPAKGNMGGQNAPRTQRRIEGAPNALDRVRQRARQDVIVHDPDGRHTLREVRMWKLRRAATKATALP
jgi:hypothetical protein